MQSTTIIYRLNVTFGFLIKELKKKKQQEESLKKQIKTGHFI